MKNKKNVIIAIMIAVALLMATGYAYFATQLNINATGNITSTWNVYFESISSGTKVGNATNVVTPSVSGTSANMNVNLNIPGDSIEYNIVLKNGGTVGAIIEDIDAVATGSSAIIYSISGLNIGDKLAAGASKTITVKIEYDPNTSSQPSETTKQLTVTIDAVQDIGQSITSSAPVIEGQLGSFGRKILSDNQIQSDTNIDFSQISSDTNGKGLYKTTTNNGTTYYFRGEVENNYVQFGVHQASTASYYPVGGMEYGSHSTYESCMSQIEYGAPWTECEKLGQEKGDPIYWRIVRINEDGTIKLIYVGNSLEDKPTLIEGYHHAMRPYTETSYKTTLETWYSTHLENAYGSYIADSAFCDDTEINNTETYENGQVLIDYYKTYDRVIKYSPTYNCDSKYQLSVANGKLSKPIGTITSDEIMYAGGVFNQTNKNYYLYSGYGYISGSNSIADEHAYLGIYLEFSVDEQGKIATGYINNGAFSWLRPVINIKGDTLFTGTGTKTNPYVIKTN